MRRWFVDTAYALALSSERDSLHRKAMALDLQIDREGIELVTTEAVLIEIASALRFERSRQIAVGAVERFWHNSIVVELTADLLHESWEMYKRHSDKEWSWVDTISFVVMRREGMLDVLTSDHHFTQAGFHALLVPDGK